MNKTQITKIAKWVIPLLLSFGLLFCFASEIRTAIQGYEGFLSNWLYIIILGGGILWINSKENGSIEGSIERSPMNDLSKHYFEGAGMVYMWMSQAELDGNKELAATYRRILWGIVNEHNQLQAEAAVKVSKEAA